MPLNECELAAHCAGKLRIPGPPVEKLDVHTCAGYGPCCYKSVHHFHSHFRSYMCTFVNCLQIQSFWRAQGPWVHVNKLRSFLDLLYCINPSPAVEKLDDWHVRWSVLQCVAKGCVVLSVLQCVAVYCSVLQYVAVCCSVLQCVAVCCSVLQCVAVCCSVLQCVAVCCSVLQCVAVPCSVLQRVAVCSSIEHHSGWMACARSQVLQCTRCSRVL